MRGSAHGSKLNRVQRDAGGCPVQHVCDADSRVLSTGGGGSDGHDLVAAGLVRPDADASLGRDPGAGRGHMGAASDGLRAGRLCADGEFVDAASGGLRSRGAGMEYAGRRLHASGFDLDAAHGGLRAVAAAIVGRGANVGLCSCERLLLDLRADKLWLRDRGAAAGDY